jgi:type III restriction enzyme
MKIQFSATQDYQNQAVQSVVRIFEGQPLAQSSFETSFTVEGASIALTERGIANNLILEEQQILDNINTIQTENNIKPSLALSLSVSDDKQITYTRLNFTVEMETGTGKTYTFLRSIYELNKTYGFKKFVIVVPSVAIREGTLKNLQITHDHFQSLYDNTSINYTMYDRSNLAALRNFATSNAIQVLVINIDSFTKDNNVINTVRETGVKPIEYIQSCRPVVIIDEPQNFETDTRRQAIANLNPLCTLRYSATHRNFYNLVYSLNPVQAYDLGLVKQIEVNGVTSSDTYNDAFIQFRGLVRSKKSIKAKISIYTQDLYAVNQKDYTIDVGIDLYDLSNRRDIYKNDFVLTEIDAEAETIAFSNGLTIKMGETNGGLNDEVMRMQIDQTIMEHFKKLKRFSENSDALQIKVLSLFFIDKVANYRQYDANGNATKGKFAEWFEASFLKHQAADPNLIPFEIEKVHNGYFSSDKANKGKEKASIWIDSKEKNTQKDDDTYSLIMKEKERLLSIDEPLQFIFSHSALREGWDNPNVFQICTLNESKSDLKKRQEIGRGLRLPVDSTGQRIQNKNINILTVIANETYEEFSKALQKEIQDETSVDFSGRIKNAKDKALIKRNKELSLENFPLLFEIWEKINQKTRYSVEFSTDILIQKTVESLKKIPKVKRPLIESRKASLEMSEEGITTIAKESKIQYAAITQYQIPNVYAYIQNKIDITRTSIHQILLQSEKLSELEINPQQFLDNVVMCIKQSLNTLLVDGVRYTEINGKRYEMALFETEEIETYLTRLFEVTNKDKTVFNYVPIDSQIERSFAADCESDESVKFFFKLPRAFSVPTPIGEYRPDWALIFQNDSKIYFVAETKSTLDKSLLRSVEQMKIDCGSKHFALFKDVGVEYRKAITVKDLY